MSDVDIDITQVLETLSGRQPSAPALHVPGRTSLRYADLGEQIRYVRERLGHWNIGRGDIVVGVMPLRPEMAVACATIPASATFAPLSSSLTTGVYCELLARMRPKALLVPKDLAHPVRVAARRCGVAEIELMPDPSAPAGMFTLELQRQDDSLNRARSAKSEWAYVIATSGTTGRAKLVPRSHRQIELFAQNLGDWLGITAERDSVGCHVLPMHHSGGLESALIVPLLQCTSIVCLPESDIDGFFSALGQYRITWFVGAPPIYREILRRTTISRDTIARNKLRCMTVGTGRLEPDEINRLEQTFGSPLLTRYGLTEAKSITADPRPPCTRKRGSVGVPFCSDILIMSEEGSICATGDVGEVVVRGAQVFDGYLDDAEATAAAFVDGWFRTGDLGRFDEDGYLYLAGRVKEIINRGGEKISPVEIDSAIESLPGVRAAATFAISHPSLGEEVAAAVVTDENVTIAASDIIDRVRQRMGPKRVPRKIYFVDDLPRTDSGKIRRSELPRLLGLDQDDTAPAGKALVALTLSPLESALVGLWSSVLHVNHVGVNDDFSRLGGSPAQGATLLDNVKSLFGVEFPFERLLKDAATVAGMAQAIEAARSRAVEQESGTNDSQDTRSPKMIPRRQERDAAPLSHTQLRMWFLTRLDPDDTAYNESRAYRLTGEIDVAALQRSLHYMVRRHEILRTSYTLADGEPRQIVHEDRAIDLKLCELGTIPEPRQGEALQRLLLGEARRLFDLQSDPVLRLVLVRLGERERVLLRVIHHIASDGWSSGIFDRELCAAYAAFIEGQEPQLPALPIQYADYAVWQREWLGRESLQTQLRYWKTKLADLPTLELPTDRPRPALATHKGAHVDFDLPAALAQALKALGRREGVTLFMTLLAAFQVLLCRYSGQEDIAVGTPIAGRTRTELEGLIGFFANTLVLRTDLSGNPTFRDLLARVRETALGAYTHQDLPFEKLVEELAPARDLSRNLLFQVSFALQNAPAGALAFEDVEVSRLGLEAHSAKFDLDLAVRESAAGLHARWEYATDLFEAATIERMSGHFRQLLEAIVANPEQPIGGLPILTAGERHQLLVEWNDTATDYPRERCLHQLIEDQVSCSPDAIAVRYAGDYLTYRELDKQANALSAYLQCHAVGPGVIVGVCMQRSIDLMVTLFAVIKSGAAYLPLDPALPPERLRFMLENAAAPVLLTHSNVESRLPLYQGHLIRIDHAWKQIARPDSSRGEIRVSSDSPVYVMYTSGSTGAPKGAVVTHRGVINYLWWALSAYEVHRGDTIPVFTSMAFDLTVTGMFAPLLCGKTVQMIPEAGDVGGLADHILGATKNNSLLMLAPAHLPILELGAGETNASQLAQSLIVGGEQLHGEILEFWRVSAAETRIFNEYGPTETVVACCVFPVPQNVPLSGPVPIGKPIANTQVYILDRHREPVPIGVPGEIYVGGDGVGLGYLNRPELTAEKFLPDPFSTRAGTRMYRTGDRARYRPDGNIEFLGRIDEQVKIRGFRIELGEIESVLAEHPAVRQAVVLAREDTPGDKRLVAYVVPADPAWTDIESLRRLLRERLPDYMRPAAYVLIEHLLLTANGKINRKALPVPERRVNTTEEFQAPIGEIETALAQIWAEVLKLDRVSRQDNFFELGGHSLLATQVVARVSKRLNVELPLRSFFEAPTVAQLASDIEGIRREPNETSLEQILLEIEALTDEEATRALDRLEGVGKAVGV